MNLLPVVEFEPACYQTQNHEIPEYGATDAWVTYWKNSLYDSGIIKLEPYAEGSWFVETERLLSNLEAIEIMLSMKLKDYLNDFNDFQDFHLAVIALVVHLPQYVHFG
ncbi:hypothetical protein DSM106972_006730 [Dulcicalothrix desertica PCC 7102]|uniref:Uncharacterized protein n=1 Tax=Dulcicalothrix desertica PCC 7102 TaxID=232991 RepID=A0A433VVT9_9CYAN|nr:hypothetical protein [Dulcicalothrix desertica]RUT10178.1 hypothetical protein DSM106972_006730 [Dulcicalothrix desertica PCC 7102]